jgi:hypothetical protein
MPSVCAPMTNKRLLSMLWLIGMLAAGSKPLAAGAGPTLTPAAWLEVSERTSCEAVQDEYCVGRYGFTIRHDGTVIAGGPGGGRTVEGKITLPELEKIDSLIRAASSSARGGERTCRKDGLPGIRDQVDLTFPDGKVLRICDLGGQVGQVCCVGNWDRVRQLHDYLRGLMRRYYPVPFPTQ